VTTLGSLWSPLEPDALARAAGPAWTVRLLPTASSTNQVAAERPVAGTVVVADHQTAGRGRLDRTWETPPGTALTFSAIVDPRLDDAVWPLLPLATALAVADGIRTATGIGAGLKWPNDLLIDEDKVAGILLERVVAAAGSPLAIVGVGINVSMRADQLPVPTATSLALAGAETTRTAVFGAVVQALAAEFAALRADPARMLARYRDACVTLGRDVTVHLPDGSEHRGRATAVDDHGRLVVGDLVVGAGDVLHVRA
jgi:BirA family biotin operon repressor/biotin-[acetyl-CoA-carboxylase] ligase